MVTPPSMLRVVLPGSSARAACVARCAGVSEASSAVSRDRNCSRLLASFVLYCAVHCVSGSRSSWRIRSCAVSRLLKASAQSSAPLALAFQPLVSSSAECAATSRAPAAFCSSVMVPVQRFTCRCVFLIRFACHVPSRIASRLVLGALVGFFLQVRQELLDLRGRQLHQQAGRLRRGLRGEVRGESFHAVQRPLIGRRGPKVVRSPRTARAGRPHSGPVPTRDAIPASAPARRAGSSAAGRRARRDCPTYQAASVSSRLYTSFAQPAVAAASSSSTHSRRKSRNIVDSGLPRASARLIKSSAYSDERVAQLRLSSPCLGRSSLVASLALGDCRPR